MEIPAKLLKKWEALRSPGDSDKIAETIENGYKELVNRAFRTGKCNDTVFEVMAKFYTDKEIKMQQLLQSCK